MTLKPLAPVCMALVLVSASQAADESRTVRVQFKPGADSARITGQVTGRKSILYKLNAREGQFLTVTLRPDNPSANFNIYIPGRGPGDEALFTSATGGHQYTGQLYKTGDHAIPVFLIRAAARRNETAKFDIDFKITDKSPGEDGAAAPAAASSSHKAAYGDITFTVASAGEGEFTIIPAGLTERNDPITSEMSGRIVGVIADDIDGDNSPEVAVITEEAEEKRRTAHVFTTFAGKSFGLVNFPAVRDAKLLAGYAGGDEYQFVENTFIRRFPLYENGTKTGKNRQLQFKIKTGEAMKQLLLDRHIDF